jgi:hypothetical protein
MVPRRKTGGTRRNRDYPGNHEGRTLEVKARLLVLVFKVVQAGIRLWDETGHYFGWW